MWLAPYASHPDKTRGRRHAEPAAPTRSDFQRDRDRIVHSTAFRRLVYKTQVFLNHEGDLFRTRLTHSLEVAQLGRSIARALGLNEDLVEAIALAHDLGHTPFGHAGQDTLNECMASHGGFEHNLQSLRVIDALEERYPAYDGLNLTFETREGVLKHCSRRNAEQLEAQEPGGVGRRFLDNTQPSLEAQLCNLADEIAYNAHDIDDGVRSGLVTLAQFDAVPLFVRFRDDTLREFPQVRGKRLLFDTIRRMLSQQVYDVIDATRASIAEHMPVNADQARQCPPLVRFSPAMREGSTQLKRFLFKELYRHPQVNDTTLRAKRVISDLFSCYVERAAEMPADFAARDDRHRAVADYIAGMTDRFAIREHERLTGQRLF
ncbi:MAG: deoxyguanosinetriphosphate triphosphohydrolase [Rubrivivax sp.]|nr:MAG: deoxyguanosinetriphosphate triphosphohydrolase [Rubrivivax sp.]